MTFLKKTLPQLLSLLAGLLFVGSAQFVYAEELTPDPAILTIDRIYEGHEFNGESPPAIQWMKRRGGYTTLESPPGKDGDRDLVWNDPATGKKEVLVPSHRFIPPGQDSPLSIESYTFSEDESKLLIFTNGRRVWRLKTRGDYWVLDISSGELKQVAKESPPSTVMFATFSPDASQVAFVRENNIHIQDLHDMQTRAVTTDGSTQVINGTFDWVNEEELNLHQGYRWSPDGKWIAYWQTDTTGVRNFHLVNNTDQLYSQVQSIPYPKVGEQNSHVRVGRVSINGGSTTWLGIPGDPREHYLPQMDWVRSGESQLIVLQQLNRLQNTNLLMLTTPVASPVTASFAAPVATPVADPVKTILRETDSAWIENNNARLRWFDENRKLIWLSERDGWQHAYSVSITDGKPMLLTKGKFDVMGIDAVDPAGEWLYFSASPDQPTRRALYRVDLERLKFEPLTPADQPGTHTYDISPDTRWAVHTFSTFDSPNVVELISLPDHKTVRVFVENKELKERLAKLKQPSSEFFRVNIGEDVELDAWAIKPPGFDPAKKYPVLFFVYGEPAGQTVLDRWGGKRHLWHMMLAQQGYVVMSIDNRGTPSPRGRDWRKIVHRKIGILAAADQAAAVKTLLKERPWLDSKRVAIWGWSGGGSMTLNAILRYPDLYQAGISIAPVPNQRLYDTIYQERYMGLPGDNAEGYRLGSPITFASQLQGHLLLVHGTGDDNCHYQGTEALINELIGSNKQFEMLAYPNRSHSISEKKNTTRHLFTLMTRFLHEHVPPDAK